MHVLENVYFVYICCIFSLHCYVQFYENKDIVVLLLLCRNNHDCVYKVFILIIIIMYHHRHEHHNPWFLFVFL